MRSLPLPSPIVATYQSMSDKYVGPAAAVVATAIALAVLRRRLAPDRPPYPPGPKGYPVIGNVLDFPKDPVWEGFAKMAKEHSERPVLLNLYSHLGCSTFMDFRHGHPSSGYDGLACSRAQQQRYGYGPARTALRYIRR